MTGMFDLVDSLLLRLVMPGIGSLIAQRRGKVGCTKSEGARHNLEKSDNIE